MIRALLGLLLIVTTACTSTTVSTPPTTAPALATATPTAAPTVAVAAATPAPLATSTATVWALVCGTVSDLVRTTATTNGSLVLNSPGRAPFTVTLTTPRSPPEGGVAGYVCLELDAGIPRPIFAGFSVPGNAAAYVEGNVFPATKVKPSPTGFVVPQACAYVRPPEVGADQINFWVDCGVELNDNARGTLGAALAQQGWTGCGPALGMALFFKGEMRIVVVESSLAPGDYPRFSQIVKPGTGCGPGL